MRALNLRKTAMLLVLAVIAATSDASAQKRSRDVITRDEILKSAQVDADLYAAIKQLRPHFLEMPRGIRTLGMSSQAPLAVYIEKIRQPDVSVLTQIIANTVAEVRYLDPTRSENEYGITANGGAIVIKRYVQKDIADSLKNSKPPR